MSSHEIQPETAMHGNENYSNVPTMNGTGEGLGQIRQILVGDIVTKWETKISHMEQGVRELINHTEAKLTELEERFAALDRELKEELETNLLEVEQESEDLRSMVQGLRDEFEEQMKLIEKGKLDKNSIADVFVQWGEAMRRAEGRE